MNKNSTFRSVRNHAAAFGLLMLTGGSMAAQSISITPTILSFSARAGQVGVQTMTLSNFSDRPQTYQLTLGDWLRDSLGVHRYFAPGTIQRSCARWITFDNPTVTVEPGKSTEVRVTLKAPPDPAAAQEMKWAMIFVQNVVEQTGNNNKRANLAATVREVYRMGIHVYQTPPAAKIKEARAISLESDKNEKNAYRFTMENTGKSMLECKVNLVLTRLTDGVETKLEEFQFPVFPDARRIVKLTLPENLPKGKYSMLAVLDYDPDMPLEAIEKPVEIR